MVLPPTQHYWVRVILHLIEVCATVLSYFGIIRAAYSKINMRITGRRTKMYILDSDFMASRKGMPKTFFILGVTKKYFRYWGVTNKSSNWFYFDLKYNSRKGRKHKELIIKD